MNNPLPNLLGANWKTSLWGGITAVGIAIVSLSTAFFAASQHPEGAPPEIQFLLTAVPPRLKFYVTLLGALMTAVSGIKFALHAKSKEVVGGTVEQDAEGKVANPQEPVPAPPRAALPKG